MTNLLHRNATFVTVHNECSKIAPSTSMHFAVRVCRSCAYSSELIFAFLYAGSSIQNAREQFVLFIHLPFVNFAFIQAHKQKYNGIRSGYSNNSVAVTIQNSTHFYMNCSFHNDRYYQLVKYLPFPLNHPV